MIESKSKYLIILRGVPGSGKTQVATMIVQKLNKRGCDAIFWNLDVWSHNTANDAFWGNLAEVIKHQYVIAEMVSGNWHSLEPYRWINHFKQEYKIHSFLLEISIEDGFRNYGDPRHPGGPLSLVLYKYLYDKFWNRENEKAFSLRANISREIRKHSGNSDWEFIADEILKECGIA